VDLSATKSQADAEEHDNKLERLYGFIDKHYCAGSAVSTRQIQRDYLDVVDLAYREVAPLLDELEAEGRIEKQKRKSAGGGTEWVSCELN
jgi:hypothetical protein